MFIMCACKIIPSWFFIVHHFKVVAIVVHVTSHILHLRLGSRSFFKYISGLGFINRDFPQILLNPNLDLSNYFICRFEENLSLRFYEICTWSPNPILFILTSFFRRLDDTRTSYNYLLFINIYHHPKAIIYVSYK